MRSNSKATLRSSIVVTLKDINRSQGKSRPTRTNRVSRASSNHPFRVNGDSELLSNEDNRSQDNRSRDTPQDNRGPTDKDLRVKIILRTKVGRSMANRVLLVVRSHRQVLVKILLSILDGVVDIS